MPFSLKNTFGVIVIFVLSFLSYAVYAQAPNWLSYTNGKNVTALALESGNLWIGTANGGLVKLQYQSGAMTFYNKANSGLPTNSITSLAIDTAGGIKWIGTNMGLLKYNGTTWTIYNKGNSSLPSDTVLAVAVDRARVKWILTLHALTRYNDTNWTVFPVDGVTLHSANLYSLACDSLLRVWIGGDNGLDMFDGTNWSWFNPINSGIPSFFITSISPKSANTILVGTKDKGAGLLVDETWTTYDHTNSTIPNDSITVVLADKSNNLWFGTRSGLAKYNVNWSLYSLSNSQIPDNKVNCLVFDSNSNLWVGTSDSLGRLSGSIWKIYDPSNLGVPENNLKFIGKDNFGYKWLASSSYGVFKWDANNWTSYNTSNSGIASNNVFYIAADASNNKWFCTDHGLSKFTDSTWTTYKRSNSNIPSDSILCIAFDGNSIWVTTNGYGVAKFNGTTWTKYNSTNSGLTDDYVQFVSVDVFGNKWFCTMSSGLIKFDGTNWTVYDHTNSGLPGDNVKYMAYENNRKKWFATTSGLAMFNDTTWVNYTQTNSALPDNNLTVVVVDPNGTKWVGTGSSGLLKFDGATWTQYKMTNSPMPDNNITSMLSDASGNIWSATSSGGLHVYRFGGILPTISTAPLLGPYCVDYTPQVVYHVFASDNFVNFTGSNIFTVQLSDNSGSFAVPVNIGQLTSQVSGTIVSRIPKTSVYGTGYRVRVTSSSPAVINGDDGVNFTIFTLPTPVINGNGNVCSGGLENYYSFGPPGMAYSWRVVGGVIKGKSTDSTLSIIWGATGAGSIILIQTTPPGCKDSTILNVTIASKPPKKIFGDTTVCANSYKIYSTVEDSSFTNRWVATGGTVESITSYNNCKVLWGNIGTGTMKLIQTTKNGCSDSITITIHKIVSPNTSFTGPDTTVHNSTNTYRTSAPPAGITNKWYVAGGNINGSSVGNTVSVIWANGPSGNVELVQSTAAGCKDSMSMDVFIYQPVSVDGKSFVCANNEEDYYALTNLSANCKWTVTGGTVNGATNQKILKVDWGNAGSGTVKLVQTYPVSGYKDSLTLQIQINPKPPKPTITGNYNILTSSLATGNQWYINGQKIKGATGQTYYTQEVTAIYSVMVTDSIGCQSDMSDPYNFVSEVYDIMFNDYGIKVFPNPTTGKLEIDINNNSQQPIVIKILNLLGVELFNIKSINSGNLTQSVDLNQYSDGIYLLQIQIGNKTFQEKIILSK